MSEDHGRGVVQQRLPQHLARVHSGAVDGAAEQLLERDEPVTIVQEQAAYLYAADRARQQQTAVWPITQK